VVLDNVFKAKPKAKIGILYICTGRYIQFFDSFYQNSELNLLQSYEKHYFVFTENELRIENKRVHRVYQAKLGWPYDTLMRFHLFISIEKQLQEMSYLFFFNANIIINQRVGEEIIPSEKDNCLVGVNHPGFYKKNSVEFPYERNELSTACIPYEIGDYYYQGCLSGGRTSEYLAMCEKLKNNIDIDLSNELIAVWHDESHLNKYFLEHKPKILSPSYAYPETWKIPFRKKIVQLDKNKLGGHAFLRS
jgi:Glycosyltransferase family 6